MQHTIATAAELAECFVDPKVGLRKCSFSQKYDVFGSDGLSEEDEINETNNIGSPYVGVVEYIPEDIQTSEAKSPIQRFVYEHSHASLMVRHPQHIASLYLRNLSLTRARLRGKFETETPTGTKSGPNRIGRQNLVLHSRVIKVVFRANCNSVCRGDCTLFCFLGERTLERALTGGSMNPFSSSSSQKRSGIDLD